MALIALPRMNAVVVTGLVHALACSGTPTFVSIKGERHHGTNWVRQMINIACPTTAFIVNDKVDSDGAWGWKHGMFTFDLPPPNVLPLVLYRRIDTWLPHMARNTYEEKHRRTNGAVLIEDLISRPFPCSLKLDALCPPSGEYNNAIKMLQAKYKAWSTVPGIHLCYDKLSDLGPSYLTSVLLDHNISCSVAKMKLAGYRTHTNKRAPLRKLTDAQQSYVLRFPTPRQCEDSF